MQENGQYSQQEISFTDMLLKSAVGLWLLMRRLWPWLLLVMAVKVLTTEVYIILLNHIKIPFFALLLGACLVFINLWLWCVILAAADKLLLGGSELKIKDCFTLVWKKTLPILLSFVCYALWVLYAPHIFIGLFSMLFSKLGVSQQWIVIASYLLGSLIILSGIITYLFVIPLLLTASKSLAQAFVLSGQLVSTNWIYVMLALAFCVISALLTRPDTLLFSRYLSYAVATVVEVVVSFILYPLYVVLILHLLNFVRVRTPDEMLKSGKIRLR